MVHPPRCFVGRSSTVLHVPLFASAGGPVWDAWEHCALFGELHGCLVTHPPFGRPWKSGPSRAASGRTKITGFSPRGRFPNLETYFSSRDKHHVRSPRGKPTIRSMDAQRTFFITPVTWQRLPIFRVEARALLLIEVLLDYRHQGKYLLHEFVVMPDHIHVLLTPALEIALERAVQFLKGGYSYRLRKAEKIQVWQQSFTNHRIRDAEDYERHCGYIRLNPVRAQLVRDAAAYPFSSASPGMRLDEMPPGLKPVFPKSA
jgi:putative transposase